MPGESATRDSLAADERLRVTEIFHSIQGESRPSGCPTVFVRLTGCPLRCGYCDTEYAFSGGNWYSFEQILAEVQSYSAQYVCVTGGEPLVRHNVMKLIADLGELDQLTDLVMTTNGSQLSRYSSLLKEAGMKRINISLDSLDADRFRHITRIGDLSPGLEGIDTAVEVGFEGLKLNAVILKGRNDDEVTPLFEFAAARDMDISYIEEMPLGIIDAHDRAEVYYSSDQIRADLERKYTLTATTETTGGPSRYFRVAQTGTRVGFISPHSHNFCADCNRVRLTVEGRLLLCLGQEHSVDLKKVVRAHPADMERLKEAIRAAMHIKPEGHDFNLQAQPVIFRHMSVTGG